MKLYLITFNVDPAFNPVAFHAYLTSLYPNVVVDWWHYLTYTYIVASNYDVNTIYNSVFPGAPGRHLLITEISPANIQGWLSIEAWQWIQKYRA
jgi:hypothetical protein